MNKLIILLILLLALPFNKSFAQRQMCREGFAAILQKGDTLVSKNCDIVIMSKQEYTLLKIDQREKLVLLDSFEIAKNQLKVYKAQYNALRFMLGDSAMTFWDPVENTDTDTSSGVIVLDNEYEDDVTMPADTVSNESRQPIWRRLFGSGNGNDTN